MSFLKPFSAMRGYLLFWLTFFSLVGVFALAFTKGTDISILVPALVGIYATHSATKQVSAHVNARLDSDAGTENVIATSNEK